MVNYPNGKKNIENKRIVNFANRGMSLENDLNASNQYFLDNNIANIHKKPTPIQIVKVDYPKRSAAKISEAYFKLPSTTDYNGVYKARAIDFEAKECSGTSFSFRLVHKHQISHLESVLYHGAIAFFIIRFTRYDKTFFIEANKVIELYYNSDKKSINYSWFLDNGIIIPYNYSVPVNYIKVLEDLYF